MTTRVKSVIEVLTKDRSSKVLADIGRAGAQAFKLLAGAAALATAGLTAIIATSAKSTDAMGELAKKTGTSVEFMSSFAFAADQADVSAEQLRVGLIALARRATDMPKNFKKWQISTEGVNGGLADTETLLGRVADRIKRATGASERLAIADSLLSEAGRQLVPLLAQGSEGLRKFREEADRLGLVVSPLSAAIADELNNEFGRLRFQTDAFKRQITDALGPVIISLSRKIREVVGAATQWAKANQQVIRAEFIGALIWMADTGLPAVATGALLVAKAVLGISLVVNTLRQGWAGFMFLMLKGQAEINEAASKFFLTLSKTAEKVPGLKKVAEGYKNIAVELFTASARQDVLAEKFGKDFDDFGSQLAATAGKIKTVEGALGKMSAKGSQALKEAIAGLRGVLGDLADLSGQFAGQGGGEAPALFGIPDVGTIGFFLDAHRALLASQDQLAIRAEALRRANWWSDWINGIELIKTTLTTLQGSFNQLGSSLGTAFGEFHAGIIDSEQLAKKAGLAFIDTTRQIIMSLAASAAAKALDAHAFLPFVGIAIGTAAAGAAFAAVSAYAGSFEEGGIVPRTGFALVHKDEMVVPRNEVPAALAAGFGGRDAIGNGMGGGGNIIIQQQMLTRPSRTVMDETNRDVVMPSSRRLARLGHA